MVIRNVLKNLVVLFILSSCTTTKQNNVERIISEFNNSTSPNVLVVAHRGDWRHAPENSIEGLKLCIEKGIDIVEVDVRLTKDKQLVLMHDLTIDRTTSGKGKVSDHTLDELKQLFLKNNQGGKEAELTTERIPTLEETLLEAKGKIMLNLDKAWDIMSEVNLVLIKTQTVEIAILKGRADADQVLKEISTFDDKFVYMPIIADNEDNAITKLKDQLEKLQPKAFELFLRESDTIMKQSEYLKNHGSRVWINSLWSSLCFGHEDSKAIKNPNENWGWIIEKGANIICTDYPNELLQYLEENGLRNF